MRIHGNTGALLLSLFSLVLALPAGAQDKQAVRFNLDWIVGGRHAGFFTAQEKGYYAEEGLSVTITRGFGAEDGIRRLVASESDISLNDIPLAMLARVRDGAMIKAVMVMYAKHPSTIFTLKKDNITNPKALEGLTLAESAGSINLLLFPAFARLAGFDANKVKWVIVPPDAKMQMLLAGKVQGTLFLGMQLPLMEKLTADKGGVNTISMGDYLPMYSVGILVRDDYLAKSAETVRKFLRASIKGWTYAFENPDEAAKLVVKSQPLLDLAVTKQEILIVKGLASSAESQKFGLGYMDEGRARTTRDTMLKLFDVKKSVPMSQLYSNEFLPRASR